MKWDLVQTQWGLMGKSWKEPKSRSIFLGKQRSSLRVKALQLSLCWTENKGGYFLHPQLFWVTWVLENTEGCSWVWIWGKSQASPSIPERFGRKKALCQAALNPHFSEVSWGQSNKHHVTSTALWHVLAFNKFICINRETGPTTCSPLLFPTTCDIN